MRPKNAPRGLCRVHTQGAFVNGETIVVDGGGVAAGKDGFPASKL